MCFEGGVMFQPWYLNSVLPRCYPGSKCGAGVVRNFLIGLVAGA